MDSWKLPTTINLSGTEYKIRTDYRVILDILMAVNDDSIFEPGMTEEEKEEERVFTMLDILYVDFDSIPINLWNEAIKKACDFIDCGIKSGDKKGPQTMDWKKDAPIIIPAINKAAKKDIRSVKYMHWWTFFGLYMEIGESMFATVVSVREKIKKGKKLEKWEKEFYHSNKEIIDLKSKKSERSEEEKEELRNLFGFK